VETDSRRMCELLVRLPDVNIEGVGDWPRWLRIEITTRTERPDCPGCGGGVWHRDDVDVELVDLPCFGRRTRQVWSQSRWRRPNPNCKVVTSLTSCSTKSDGGCRTKRLVTVASSLIRSTDPAN